MVMVPAETIEMQAAEAADRVKDKNAEIARLRAALEEIVDPLRFMRERAEANGDRLSGMAYSIANDLHYVKEIARKALTG